MAKMHKCECGRFIVSDIEFTTIRIDPGCPKCGRSWFTFHVVDADDELKAALEVVKSQGVKSHRAGDLGLV